MPAKKKLTKKKPAAKAAQPSSKKRPMPTKAKPAAKAKPMAKKKKPAVKKPARRPFHEGGMIDMELQMLEDMAQAAMFEARNSNNPETLARIFDDLSVGIDQVRMVNEREMERGRQPRPNPNVPQPQITPEQQQAARRMNQAQFMRPQFPRRGTNPQPILPKDPPFKKDMPGYDPNAPAPPQKPIDTSGPLYDAPRDFSGLKDRINRMENNRNPQRTGPRYVDTATGGSRPSNFTPGPRRPQRIGQPAIYPDGSRPPSRFRPTPTPMGPRAGGAINPNPTRVPLNQPPMDRRPTPIEGNTDYSKDPRAFRGGPTVTPQQEQAMRAMNQARFATPRPMNKGGMVLRPEQYQKAAIKAKAMTPKKKFT
tara:strand:+ start:1183 stop:2280 length:1098 start_codon:yes stop_codon:yes gene_type:complete